MKLFCSQPGLKLYNRTKWKGRALTLEEAKKSFMDRYFGIGLERHLLCPEYMVSKLRQVFLALLDCVSRANAMARASVVRPSVCRPLSVRKTRFLRNRQAN